MRLLLAFGLVSAFTYLGFVDDPEDLAKLALIALLFSKNKNEKEGHIQLFSPSGIPERTCPTTSSIWQMNKNLCPQMISDKTLCQEVM